MSSSPTDASDPHDPIIAVPVRHWGRWLSAAASCSCWSAWLVEAAISADFIDFAVVRKYLFHSLILKGLWATIVLAVVAQIAGIVLGVVFAVMRLSKNPVMTAVSSFYIWFFRGTPRAGAIVLLVQRRPPHLPDAHDRDPLHRRDALLHADDVVHDRVHGRLLALALNEGAYMAEIVRAGIISVDEGQVEAAPALGMTPALTLRRIVLPQAMRVIIPPTGNEFISMLKTTSLASTITYGELLRRAGDIYSTNLEVVPLLIVASIWYLVLTSVATVGQYYIERRFARGRMRTTAETPLQRVRNVLQQRPRL